jgi:hypothetical protein
LRPASISKIAWCPIKRIRREKPEVAAHLGLFLFGYRSAGYRTYFRE